MRIYPSKEIAITAGPKLAKTDCVDIDDLPSDTAMSHNQKKDTRGVSVIPLPSFSNSLRYLLTV